MDCDDLEISASGIYVDILQNIEKQKNNIYHGKLQNGEWFVVLNNISFCASRLKECIAISILTEETDGEQPYFIDLNYRYFINDFIKNDIFVLTSESIWQWIKNKVLY